MDISRLQNEKLHSLYRSPNTVRVIKSRRLRWAGNVARMEEVWSAFKILMGIPTRNYPWVLVTMAWRVPSGSGWGMRSRSSDMEIS